MGPVIHDLLCWLPVYKQQVNRTKYQHEKKISPSSVRAEIWNTDVFPVKIQYFNTNLAPPHHTSPPMLHQSQHIATITLQYGHKSPHRVQFRFLFTTLPGWKCQGEKAGRGKGDIRKRKIKLTHKNHVSHRPWILIGILKLLFSYNKISKNI